MAGHFTIRAYDGNDGCSLANCPNPASRALTFTLLLPLTPKLKIHKTVTFPLCVGCELELKETLANATG